MLIYKVWVGGQKLAQVAPCMVFDDYRIWGLRWFRAFGGMRISGEGKQLPILSEKTVEIRLKYREPERSRRSKLIASRPHSLGFRV